MIYALGGFLLGIVIALLLPVSIPAIYAKYTSVALLAALDTVFGGVRSALDRQFDLSMFITGFFSNSILAALLVFLGQNVGIDLYYVALITFGIRIFNNTASIRNLLITAYRVNKSRKTQKYTKS